MMRVLVRCGMERDEGALLRTEETVPGVRPRWSATAFRVTTPGFLSRNFLSLGIIASATWTSQYQAHLAKGNRTQKAVPPRPTRARIVSQKIDFVFSKLRRQRIAASLAAAGRHDLPGSGRGGRMR